MSCHDEMNFQLSSPFPVTCPVRFSLPAGGGGHSKQQDHACVWRCRQGGRLGPFHPQDGRSGGTGSSEDSAGLEDVIYPSFVD